MLPSRSCSQPRFCARHEQHGRDDADRNAGPRQRTMTFMMTGAGGDARPAAPLTQVGLSRTAQPVCVCASRVASAGKRAAHSGSQQQQQQTHNKVGLAIGYFNVENVSCSAHWHPVANRVSIENTRGLGHAGVYAPPPARQQPQHTANRNPSEICSHDNTTEPEMSTVSVPQRRRRTSPGRDRQNSLCGSASRPVALACWRRNKQPDPK